MYATIDIETTGLNRYTDKVTYVGIGITESLDDEKFKAKSIINMSKDDAVEKLKKVCRFLKKNKATLVFQNGNFDTLFLEWNYDIKLPVSDDIMLMGTAYDLSAKHGLKDMAQEYLGVKNWDIAKKDKLMKGKDSAKTLVPYLGKDVTYTWQLYRYFRQNMEHSQIKIYKKLLKPAYSMYKDIERYGIYFDQEKYKEVKKKYHDIEEEYHKKLTDRYDINWNSSAQKSRVLFTDPDGEQLPIIKYTDSGNPSADAGVLTRLAAQGHEVPKLMLEYTAANTLNKMFLNRWGEDSSYDGRIHASYNLTNVISGRTSSSNPNLQQVPRTPDVRGLFHAPEGKCFFEADYSQLELRIAAHYANEPTMLRIYKENGDIHTETAKLMTGGREPTKDERRKAKSINFGKIRR